MGSVLGGGVSHINWLEVEGVRYEGLGDCIHCQTAVGFHSRLPGLTLEELEVSDAHGNPLGYLSVDFASGNLAMTALVPAAELATTRIWIGDESGVHSVALNELPSMPSLLASLIEDGQDELDLSPPAPAFSAESDYALALTSLVCDADETLDAFFGESGEPSEASHLTAANLDPSVSLTSLYLEHGSEPLQMPLLPENPELTHLF